MFLPSIGSGNFHRLNKWSRLNLESEIKEKDAEISKLKEQVKELDAITNKQKAQFSDLVIDIGIKNKEIERLKNLIQNQ